MGTGYETNSYDYFKNLIIQDVSEVYEFEIYIEAYIEDDYGSVTSDTS
jgi:hypothetical protein